MNFMDLSKDLPISFKNENEKQLAFEQYKILSESLNKLLEVRGNANNFWTTTNSVALSALAYIKDAGKISVDHKHFALWTIIAIGICLSSFWISYLLTAQKEIEVRNKLLMEIENYFPIPLFKNIFTTIQVKPGKSTLTIKEILIPALFLLAYLFFIVILIFFKQDVVNDL